MSSVLDFPTWIPPGSKMPGGMVTPVSYGKVLNGALSTERSDVITPCPPDLYAESKESTRGE
jgi:hypothetical protein